jgi:DNA-directed RNA polymerase specialized sigma24 family protein
MNTIEFTSVVTKWKSSLNMFAMHFTRDPEDANDLVQETCSRHLRIAPNLRMELT